jgi:pimeloyl-ACP methyl ester carboxylesterase
MMQTGTGSVELGGGSTYFEVAGMGEPLVFLHAGFVDSRMWDMQWDELARHNTVIRYDMRGFGRSDRLEMPISRRQELYRVLMETGIRRAALVGCSMGGETILDVALERPELVSALIVVSAVPDGFEMQGKPPAEFLGMLAASEQGDLALASELQMRLWIDGPFRQPEQVDQLVRRRAAEMSRTALSKGTWGLVLEPLPDPLDPPAARRLSQITAPTLIIAGELDNPEFMRAAELMAGEIPGAQKLIMPGCAHLPNMVRPAEFNRAVRDFLYDIPGVDGGSSVL